MVLAKELVDKLRKIEDFDITYESSDKDSGDVIMFVDDLDTLRDSMELEYKIEIVDGDE